MPPLFNRVVLFLAYPKVGLHWSIVRALTLRYLLRKEITLWLCNLNLTYIVYNQKFGVVVLLSHFNLHVVWSNVDSYHQFHIHNMFSSYLLNFSFVPKHSFIVFISFLFSLFLWGLWCSFFVSFEGQPNSAISNNCFVTNTMVKYSRQIFLDT